ncbi:hypothetical protein APR50_00290 [Variovorax paradoxus]|jgi:hypothetical protein|uniref:DUF1161 domain-containing protein n=1 Tax=Variovorax paradoxus TaxID=34073 RepID=UPI0006E60658|nr:hypothetical protein APR52_00745 [Variovorax paradoxus]KPV07341.1 hypothetical protein APR49_17985 [Variovorax paradoxus]KPV12451.1 hypothetical protein APR50_00290 [Variovorax paradoxus]KPV24683.1 hypothetical protein APR51_03445 [Variovorax paradoxus]KPV24701.1 hypothetical protein APR51_03560 [Variovorax paradoxus]
MKPSWLAMLPAVLALAGAAGSAHAAEDCEALRTRIESKIAAAGVARFTVAVVDANASTSGQVVGSCELGSRKIVYERDVGTGAGLAPGPGSAAVGEPMLTECRDGTVSMGGDCK